MPKPPIFDLTPQQETAVLVGVQIKGESDRKLHEYLDELEFLVSTAGAKTLKQFSQKLDYHHPRTFIGEGKLQEVVDFVTENKVDMVVFDDELNPSQIRNLEKVLSCKILDRTNLILDIFAKRAQTATAKAQVELAQVQYLLPRLTRMWTHLQKQKAGVGMRGPGEKEIETDRRAIRERIALLKDRLSHIDRQQQTQRKSRFNQVRVALVGYTNVGKSTLMNSLSKASVFAENKLFATLDTTVRKVVIDRVPFLLSDTVGFIRKLPTALVESFKSTLDEVREADILLHVVDISHPEFEHHIRVVNQTLQEIGARDKPTIMVFNKMDAYRAEEEGFSLEDFRKSWMAKENAPAVFTSATKKQNLDELRQQLIRVVTILRPDLKPEEYGEEE